MSDEVLRNLERQLLANPYNRNLVARLLQARIRSGLYPYSYLNVRHVNCEGVLEIWNFLIQEVLPRVWADEESFIKGLNSCQKLELAAAKALVETNVSAEVHSDDYEVQITFDAFDWFEQATDTEILDLAAIGWGGDYESDAVAEFFRDTTTQELFQYLKDPMSRPCGFECHINDLAAIRWISKNRPYLLARELPNRLQRPLDFPTE